MGRKLLMGCGNGGGGAASSLLTDLVAYWSLDEASGTRLDSHGINDLTDNNTVGSAAGKVGTAADFDSASNESLTHTSSSDLQTGDIDFTFAGWMKIESRGTHIVLINKGAEYLLWVDNTASRLVFRVDVGGPGNGQVQSDALGEPPSGVWIFVVAWHDAAGNVLGIQVNNGTADTVSYSAGASVGANTFEFGNGLGGFGFNGLLDEWGFWKRVLTADEKAALYNGGSGKTYPFS